MTELQTVWGWEPALYLFLGGMGAGAFIVASILYGLESIRYRRLVSLSLWASVICLAIGLLLLLAELSNPLRGLLLWQSFSNLTSWMALGAWVLLAAFVVFFVSAVCSLQVVLKRACKRQSSAVSMKRFRSALFIIGSILALGVAIYTGILLAAAPGIPLWNTALLPLLFTISALDTGVALVAIIAALNHSRMAITPSDLRILERSVVVLTSTEIILLIALIIQMFNGIGFASVAAETARSSILLLTSHSLAAYFWGLLFTLGLLMPLILACFSLWYREAQRVESVLQKNSEGEREDREPKQSTPSRTEADLQEKDETGKAGSEPNQCSPFVGSGRLLAFGGIGTLIGGCTLRFLILLAGQHADYVGGAVPDFIKEIILSVL